ncbi:MAG TPA: hypothetical protein VEM35_09190, partial [Rhizomicrobium sp.]|nr:hypothetical protein [Rhizomicrobium sp.]
MRLLKSALAIADRGPYAGVAEADDICMAIARQIDGEPRVPTDPPSLLIPKVGEDEIRVLEGAVAIAARCPHAGVAEADDVGISAARQIGEKSRVLVDPPSAGIIGEIGEDKFPV